MQLTIEHPFRGHLRPVWGSLLPWEPQGSVGSWSQEVAAHCSFSSCFNCLHPLFFCLPALSVSTPSSVPCSPGAILGLHTQEEGMFSLVGLSQYLPDWPLCDYRCPSQRKPSHSTACLGGADRAPIWEELGGGEGEASVQGLLWTVYCNVPSIHNVHTCLYWYHDKWCCSHWLIVHSRRTVF